jgi:AhpD family alkylhydroperoxidase
MTDWPDMIKDLTPHLRDLRQSMPEVMKAFAAVSQAALSPKALDTKTKELIALAIAVALRSDDCIAFHVKSALQQGASREEVTEALGMAIYMGAGPSVMYASHALDAYEQLDEKAKSEGRAA